MLKKFLSLLAVTLLAISFGRAAQAAEKNNAQQPGGSCSADQASYKVGLATERGVYVVSFCSGSLNALASGHFPGIKKYPGFEKCTVRSFLSDLSVVARLQCGKKGIQHAWDSDGRSNCRSIGFSPDGLGWDTENGIVAWEMAAAACGNVEGAEKWRGRKDWPAMFNRIQSKLEIGQSAKSIQID